MFDPDTTAAFMTPAKQTDWTRAGASKSGSDGADAVASTPAPADRADAGALNSLFARAAQGKPGDDASAAPLPAQPPVVVADASATSVPMAPLPPPVERVNTEPRGRAYLFRGVAGLIYSRGMDRLAERINRAGISASVSTYLMWRGVVDDAIRSYRRDQAPITIIGHSMGGDAAVALAEALNGADVPVSLLVTYDPTRIADDVPPNVERYINIYQSSNIMGGGNVVPGARFHGHYASYNLKDHSEIVHINIEKADRIQEQLVTKIVELAATPAAAEGEAVPLHLEVPAEAGIELWDSGTPVAAHAGDTLKTLAATYHVPVWAVAQINSLSDRAALNDGQRIVIPRHLVPMPTLSTVTSYAPTGH